MGGHVDLDGPRRGHEAVCELSSRRPRLRCWHNPRTIPRMPERIGVLLAVIDKLVRKSRKLAEQQKKLWQQIDDLRQELAAIRQDSAAKKRPKFSGGA